MEKRFLMGAVGDEATVCPTAGASVGNKPALPYLFNHEY